MGNLAIVPIHGVDDEHKIKWKQGTIDQILPFSHDCRSYEDLKHSTELKDYILHHLDDDRIVDYLLDYDSCEEQLFEPLKCFRQYSTEELSMIVDKLKGIENCSTAGVNVKLSEVIRILTQYLETLAVVTPSAYTEAMQRKFTILSYLGNAMTEEHDRYVRFEKQRKWNQHGLNSIEHPQTKVLVNSYQFGINVLKMLENLNSEFQPINLQILSSPILALCDSMKSSTALEFFKCWSPRQAHSRRLIPYSEFKLSGSRSSMGDSCKWSATNIEFSDDIGTVIITFNTPTDLSAIELNWISSLGVVSAPDQYVVYLKESSRQSFHKFGSFLSASEKVRGGSWNQVHLFHSAEKCNILIESLKITVSQKLCKHNEIGKCCLQGLSLYAHDPTIISIQTMRLFQQMNCSLYPLMRYTSLKPQIFGALFGNIKSSGSLCLILEFIQRMLQDEIILGDQLSIGECASVNEFIGLLSTQEMCVLGILERSKSPDVTHDLEIVCTENLKSEHCKIINGNTITFSPSASGGFCIFKIPVAGADMIELELKISEVENIQIGFITASDKYESPLDIKKCCLLRLSDGTTRLREVRIEEPFVTISGGDTLKLFYDCKKEIIMCSINDQSTEVLFENWTTDCLPVLVCDAADHDVSIEVPSLKSISHQEETTPKFSPQHAEFPNVNMESTHLDTCCIILRSVAWYCQTLSSIRSILNKQKSLEALSSWEYPYGIDISVGTFQTISDLFTLVRSNTFVYMEELTTSLTSILQLQLNILCESSSPLSELLFMQYHQDGTTMDGLARDIFKSLSLHLQDLIHNEYSKVRVQAVQCFCEGSSLFYPNQADRMAYLSNLLRDTVSADHVLLILKVMNRVEELHELIQLFMIDSQYACSITSSISSMIEYVARVDLTNFSTVVENDQETIVSLTKTVLFRFFEHLFSSQLSQGLELNAECFDAVINLMNHLLKCCGEVLKGAQSCDKDTFVIDNLLRQSILGHIAVPMLHFFTIKSIPHKLLYGVVDSITTLTVGILEYSNGSNLSKEASFLIAAASSLGTSSSSGIKGWKTVKASFEEGDNSFSLSENGMLYTSVHSSNTCAVVNYRFTKGQKGAWEFLLESDSSNDECSVFGAARMPLSSRCYTSSPDLWMRRAYNGYMYSLGQTTGNNLEKIHPNDIVRVEYDGIAGTLSYSVNGGDLEVGFTGIVDDVYPACGSYRSSVGIRLLKVEVFDNLSTNAINDDFAVCYPSHDVAWRPISNEKDELSSPIKPLSNCLNHPEAQGSKSKKISGGKWLSSYATRGAAFGVHRWNFRIKSETAGRFSVGLILGSPNGFVSSKRLSAITPDTQVSNPQYFVWNSDGSLWCDGKKAGKFFGLSGLPLKKGSIISLVVNRTRQTLEILIDNQSLGIAFGPKSSLPFCNIPIPHVDKTYDWVRDVIFPAASVFSFETILEISSGGFKGSTVIPFTMSAALNMTSVCGRIASGLLESEPSPYEVEIHDLLESPMFIGGINEDSVAKYVAANSNFIGLHGSIQAAINHGSRSGFDSADSKTPSKDNYDGLVHTIASSNLEGKVGIFYEWLDNFDPEPMMMRKVLEKSSSYNFPNCELPALACMIRHAEIEDEVSHFFDNPDTTLTPSDNLIFIWQKVKQLRNFLRKQRQTLRSTEDIVHTFDCTSLPGTVMEEMGFGSKIQWFSVEIIDQTKDLLFLKNQEPVIQGIGLAANNSEAFVVVSNYSESKTLQSVSLIIEEEVFKCREFSVVSLGLLVAWFDLSKRKAAKSLIIKSLDVCMFDASSPEPKLRSRLSIGSEQSPENGKDLFARLCEDIQAKANFLLMIRPTFRLSGAGSKLGMVGLPSMYSTPFTPFSSSKADLSRRKTQERWKRVVEYLHVQSKLNRQLSTDSASGESSEKALLTPRSMSEDLNKINLGGDCSSAQAAIQTCAGFIISDSDHDSFQISHIIRVLQDRVLRSQYRLKGFEIIHQMLQLRGLYSNLTMLMEYLGVLKNCFPPRPLQYPGSKKLINHYLATLEGCPTRILSNLQVAAGNVYKSLSHVFEYVVDEWEKPHPIGTVGSRFMKMDARNSCFTDHDLGNVIAVLIQLWSGEFSSRDSQWIGDSAIVSLLHRVSSHIMQEKVFGSWDAVAGRLVNFTKVAHTKLGDLPFHEVSLWGAEKVEKDLITGSLTAKQLLLHLILVCAGNSFYSIEGDKSDNFLEVLMGSYFSGKYDLSTVSKHFATLTSRWTQKLEKKKEVQVKAALVLSKVESSLGCFDPEHKASNITLTDNFRVATLRQNRQGTSVCVYGSFPYSASTVSDVGNYFEITVISVGEGDIGIGFANRDSFSPTGNMPGWVSHSYGYHGDDGKKYGEGATSGDWPVFEDGDVIGCGIDFSRRSIFYTRNGMLLGDGFLNINVEEYWPIVGFSNRHTQTNQVSINFGLIPFGYSSPSSIVVNTHVTAKLMTDPTTASPLDQTDIKVVIQQKLTLESHYSLPSIDDFTDLTSTEKFFENLSTSQVQKLFKTMMGDLEHCQSKFSMLQRFSKAASMLAKLLVLQTTKSSTVFIDEIDGKGSDIPISRGISAFGSSKVLNSTEGARIVSAIAHSIGEELFSGARYLQPTTIRELPTLLAGHTSCRDVLSIQLHQQVHLSLVNQLCLSSAMFTRELCSHVWLTSLMMMLDVGNTKIKLTTVAILRKLLPTMEPEVAEKLVPMSWKEEISRWEADSVAVGHRKSIQLDVVVRKLFIICAQAFCLENQNRSVGSGDLILLTSGAVAQLIQKLSRVPQWSEIIARNITSVLRFVQNIWDNAERSAELQKWMPIASVAAFCISFKPSLQLGTFVIGEPNLEGVIVSENSGDEIHIVLRSCRDNLAHLGEIETIKKSKVEVVPSVMNMNNLSQPVIPQLLELAKTIVTWILGRMGTSLRGLKYQLGLAKVIFGAIHCLMEWNCDIVSEPLLDTSMLTELLRFASITSPLKKIYSGRELETLWNFCQARYLEGFFLEVKSQTSPDVKSGEVDENPAMEKYEMASASSSSCLELSENARSNRTELVELFASEHNIPHEFAEQLLEYCMMDFAKAHSLVDSFPINGTTTADENPVENKPKTRKGTLEDSNIFKGLDHSPEVPNAYNPQALKSLQPLSSSEWGNTGLLKLIVSNTEEESSVYNFHSMGVFVNACSGDQFVGTFLNRDLDVNFAKLLVESDWSLVERIGMWELSCFDHLVEHIDLVASIASIRNVVMMLVSGGFINASTFSANNVDFLDCAKLLSLTSSLGLNHTMSSLFAVLGSETLDDAQAALQKLVVESMAQDVKKGLQSIRDGVMTRNESNMMKTKKFTVSSTHPFNTPHLAEGKIVGDSDWKGIAISFDSKSSTPNDSAKLMFYTDEKSFLNRQPSHTFCGPSSSSNSFQNTTIPDINELFYRFEAAPRSNIVEVNLLGLFGKHIVKNGNISAVATSNVGLGDDDTLFNLFNAETPNSPSATVIADVSLSKGSCIYQVEIINIPTEEEPDYTERNLWIGIDMHGRDFAYDENYFLGCDHLGLAVNSHGVVMHNGEIKKENVFCPLQVGDVVTVKIEVEDGTSTLAVSKNGSPFCDDAKIPCGELVKIFHAGLTIPLGWVVKANFGNFPWSRFPAVLEQNILSVCECHTDAHVSRSWGFEFSASAVDQLEYDVTRDFDLVWNSKEDDSLPSRTAGPTEKKKCVWVWRPKARDNFYPVADIITDTSYPPPRHILVQKNQCAHPAKFVCVFYHSKQNVVIWRPIAPSGYVALGDLVTQGSSSSSPPATSTVLCVPLWAVKKFKGNDKMFTIKKVGEGKNIHNATLWRTGDKAGYGYFFGSPFEKPSDTLPLHSDFKVTGVGESFTFIQNFQHELDAEWHQEQDIQNKPSFSWMIATLQSLLQSEKHRHVVLNGDVFMALIDYMRSLHAVRPMSLIPILIQMIRESTALHITLPLNDLKNLCKAILSEAVNVTNVLKKSELPKGLMMLVDLVVEIQAVHVVESSLKDRQAISRNMEKGKLRVHDSGEFKDEEKDEDDDVALADIEISLVVDGSPDKSRTKLDDHLDKPADEIEMAWLKMVAKEQEKRWWDRSALQGNELKLHRVIKKDNLENLFCKESTLLKLKQVLKFLFAINGGVLGRTSLPSGSNMALERSFPKLMTSKLWFDHISSFAMFESHHPYKEKKYGKKIFFPGTQQLIVNFDRRCALSKGDKLILRTDQTEVVLSSGTESEHMINNGVQFSCSHLSITLVPGDPSTTNEDLEWGWGLIVGAAGPIYESAEVCIDLELCLRRQLSQQIHIDESALSNSFKVLTLEDDGLPEVPTQQHRTCVDDDSGSEASGPTSGLESGDHIGIGLISEEILPSNLGGEPKLIPSLRPVSKRGKRDNRTLATIVQPEASLTPSTTPAAPVDPEIEAIKTHGFLIKTGDIAIPHATSLDLTIDRLTPKKTEEEGTMEFETKQYSFVIEIVYCDIAVTEPVIVGELNKCLQFKLDPNTQMKCSISGHRAEYLVYALESSKVEEILHPKVGDHVCETVPITSAEPEQPYQAETIVSETEAEAPTVPVDAVSDHPMPVDLTAAVGLSLYAEEWGCPVCTYLNPLASDECEMCGCNRPDAEGGGAVPPEDALWCCPRCTLFNPLRAERCSVCEHVRPGSGSGGAVGRESGREEDHGDHEDEDEEDARSIPESPSTPSPKPLSPSKLTNVQKDGSDGLAEYDCIKIIAKAKLDSQARFETRLEAAVLSHGQIMTPLQVHHRVASWSKESDVVLLSYLNRKPISGKSEISPITFALSKHFLTYEGEILSRLNMLDIIIRAQLIEAFNKQLETLLPLIDLGSDDPSSFGAMIRRCNKYLLNKIKQPLLDRAISNSAAKGNEPGVPATLVLDNFKALSSREAGECDITTSSNCFAQAFKQLHRKDSVVFRHCFSTDRVFQITFADESGIDAGGVFREGVSRIIEDLFSEHFNLLILCPNGQQAVYTSMDKYLPNPKQIGPLALEMFNFVGKLMAMSIRVKLCLPFEFPSLIWKKIVGEEVGKHDLAEIDAIAEKQLDDIENCHLDAVDPVTDADGFTQRFSNKLRFTYLGSDGVERDTCVHGSSKEVTFENRHEYVSSVRNARMNEFNVQVAAIVKGMGEVIPMRALLLFSAEQLAELVCGNPKIDMDLWKSQTDSSVSGALTKLFWKVMESLSPGEQAGFIRFAWGRSRLPSRKEDFTTRMKLVSGGRAALPVSHTCFFSIELPSYTTEEEMRHGLLTAIHFGVGGILNG